SRSGGGASAPRQVARCGTRDRQVTVGRTGVQRRADDRRAQQTGNAPGPHRGALGAVELMCGIAGIWRLAGASADELAAQSRAMTDAIAYRGPDGDGHWSDPAVGIALGHRRLAIVDLTATGLQPMASHDGRIVITYNGELYNRAEMAAELDRPWRGTSDTQLLLEAIATYGIDGALARANGLFAFAAFDRGARTLHLARDRLGLQPPVWPRPNS